MNLNYVRGRERNISLLFRREKSFLWNQAVCNKQDSCFKIFGLLLILKGHIWVNSIRTSLLLMWNVFRTITIRSFVIPICSIVDSRTYWERNTNVLDMIWNSAGNYVFAEQMHKIGSTLLFQFVCQDWRTSLLIWSTSLFSEHTIVLFMNCIEWMTDVALPNISLLNDAMPISCGWIAKLLMSVSRRLYYTTLYTLLFRLNYSILCCICISYSMECLSLESACN
jgi:hypothetical protein